MNLSRKILAVLLVLLTLFCFVGTTYAQPAETDDITITKTEEPTSSESPSPSSSDQAGLEITPEASQEPLVMASPSNAFDQSKYESNSYMLVDAKTGTILVEHNSEEQIYPASTTKILTILVALENCSDLDQIVSAGSEVNRFSSDSSLMGLIQYEEMSIEDIIYGAMLVSGNDAAATIAVTFGGSIEGFADMMNQKAKELGMTHSHFVNPHGLPDEEHYTTARDMAKLAVAAYNNPDFMKYCSTKEHTIEPTNKHENPIHLKNTNRLLFAAKAGNEHYVYEGTNGMKTGTTSAAGGCLIASAKRDDKEFIALVFGDHSDGKEERWELATDLLDYGFENYSVVESDEFFSSLSVTDKIENADSNDPFEGQMQFNPQVSSNISTLTIPTEIYQSIQNDKSSITIKPNFSSALSAPFTQNQIVGTATIYYNDTALFETDLVASRDMNEAGFEGPTTTVDPAPMESLGGISTKNLLWWMIIPAVIIIFIIIKAATSRKKRRRGHVRRRSDLDYRPPYRHYKR